MIQFAVGGKLKQLVLGENNQRRLTLYEEMICGIGAGTVSALVGSPLELVMIQQQRKGKSLQATVSDIVTHKAAMRGFMGAAIREALWTCGYLSIPPVVQNTLMEDYPEQFPDKTTARIPSALIGAAFAAYLTHPADTIKTCMQGDIERGSYGSFTETGSKIWASSGIYGFYRGATFRYGRMVCAVFIMNATKDYVSQLLYPSAFK